MLASMTSQRAQPLPNRRFRRLLPAALATATIAAAMPLAGSPPAHASAPSRAHVPPRAPSKAIVPRTSTDEGSAGQDVTGI
jgi:peptidoglycan/LPS O-acetylase OafA/YrhL